MIITIISIGTAISTIISLTCGIIIIYEAYGSLVDAKTLQKTEIQGEHLVWTVGNGDPMHGVCIPHSIPRAWEQQG